jgi:hypothetical protein
MARPFPIESFHGADARRGARELNQKALVRKHDQPDFGAK